MRRAIVSGALSLVVMVWGTLPVLGQHWYEYSPPPRDFDWQIFAPVGDNVLLADQYDEDEGYFFNCERGRFWMMRPERAAIGVAGASYQAFSPNSVNYIYANTSATLGNGLNGPNAGNSAQLGLRVPIIGGGSLITQVNGIDDAYVRHASGWGNHFEFGWVEDYHGWMVTLYQGIDVHRTDLYGFDDKRRDQLGAATGLNGIDGIPDIDGPGGIGPVNPVAPVNGIQGIIAIDGFLEVPVVFENVFIPGDTFLLGFTDTNFNQLPDDRNGDGLINELDLVRIAVVFDDMRVDVQTNVNSVEVMAIRRKKQLPGGGTGELFLGARYLEFDDRFNVLARGGTLADTSWNNHALNRIVGPQLGVRVAKSHARWQTSIQGRFTAGANFLSVRQSGVVGNHLTNGFPGVPNFMGANAFFHRLSEEQFSPTGELSYETSFQLTRHAAFKVSWVGAYVGGVTRASNTVVYRLPNLGIRHREEDLFMHGVTAGIEINR